MEKGFALFGKLSLGILVAAILVGGGIYLGIKGNKKVYPSPTPNQTVHTQASPSPIQATPASSSAQSNQTVVVDGASPFDSFSAVIPQGWQTKKEIIAERVKVTFSNADTSLIISQVGGDGGQCIYPGEQPVNFSSTFQTPTSIEGANNLKFKRAQPSTGGQSNGVENFTVCQQKSGNFQFPTEFGYITYETAKTPQNSTLLELDQIVSTLKKQ